MARTDSPRPDTESVYATVIDTVARRENVAPTQLESPLYDVLDPDALGDLLSSMRNSAEGVTGYVAFAYHGYEVTIYSDGRVTADELTDRSARFATE